LDTSTETEDLDLLGATTVLRRASVAQPRGTETPVPWAQADVIFDNFLNANPDAFGAIPPMDDNDQVLNAATLDWSGFDMEAVSTARSRRSRCADDDSSSCKSSVPFELFTIRTITITNEDIPPYLR
jgi:hypothetical protein